MENNVLKTIDEVKDSKEVMEIVYALINLNIQIEMKNRDKMIDALKTAQQIAEKEIVNTISQTGTIYSKPWECISDDELYHMLFQYKEGLTDKGINKVGEKAFKEIYEECNKSKQFH